MSVFAILVALPARAWIETLKEWQIETTEDLSLSPRERGLKLICHTIEYFWIKSLSPRERGLKPSSVTLCRLTGLCRSPRESVD